MPPFTAFLDANVLYPADLRSFLMFLAVPGIFRAQWSNDVHEEWISNLLERRPDLTRAQLEEPYDEGIPSQEASISQPFGQALTPGRDARIGRGQTEAVAAGLIYVQFCRDAGFEQGRVEIQCAFRGDGLVIPSGHEERGRGLSVDVEIVR